MTYRKILYGYQIQRGEIVVQEQEADIVKRIATLYIGGLSYQKIADTLNGDSIPFCTEVPLWNKHKVKRLLENSRYTGTDGYPAILENDVFQMIQHSIRGKTTGYVKREKRPALELRKYLRCGCGGDFHRTAGTYRRTDTLYLKCAACEKRLTILDADLLNEVTKQMAEHAVPAEDSYAPSSEVIRLANAVNRQLEHPDHPEDAVALILQGISARYDCCPALIASDTFNCPAGVDFKSFGQATRAGLAVSHITISDGTITVHFK